MDFALSKEQELFFQKTLIFAKDNLNENLLEKEQQHLFSRKEWKMCGEFGLLGLSIPEEYGGIGLDALSTALAVEAFGQGCRDAGLVFSACAHLFACLMPILESGSEETKMAFLPKLASGEWVGANAITESEAGSDVFALKTKAVQEGDHYLITGSKTYVTNGPVADVFLVYATTNPSYGHMGISAFIVEKSSQGLTISSPFSKMGLTTSPICQIFLDECRVPAKNRLGKEGDGASIFKQSMIWERACLFAAYVGAMERQLNQAIEYAIQRKQFRKSIGKNQAISHRIVDMKMRLDCAKLLLYRACWLKDQKRDATTEISLSKLAISEAAVASGLDLIQIYGGNGFITENGIERALRDAIPSKIFSGTSEIQKDIIAKGLGL
jgi:L-prolyl-PCP dehydrogenase